MSVPQSQLRKLSAVAWLRVSNDGILTSWGFDKKSGNAAFDNMIEMTLKDQNSLQKYLSHPLHVGIGQRYNPFVEAIASFDCE